MFGPEALGPGGAATDHGRGAIPKGLRQRNHNRLGHAQTVNPMLTMNQLNRLKEKPKIYAIAQAAEKPPR